MSSCRTSKVSKVHGGLLETLLAAASCEDELVIKLLQASARGERSKVLKFAKAIAEARGEAHTQAGKSKLPSQRQYKDKYLAALFQEEALLQELVTAVAGDAHKRIFTLCGQLAANRVRYDPTFERENHSPEDLTP